MPRSSTGTTSAERVSRFSIPPERRTFTTPSPRPASSFRAQEQMTYPELLYVCCLCGGVQNWDLKQTTGGLLIDQKWFTV
jgi:hypothetical protein